MYAVVTNCTYDGLCYNADARRSGCSAKRWTASISTKRGTATRASIRCMRDRFAMRGDPAEHATAGPTVFATHSTHKLLAALSQASYIHVRDGRGAIEHGRFNEAYMHAGARRRRSMRIDRVERHRGGDDGRRRRPRADARNHRRGGRVPPGRGADRARASRRRSEWFFTPWNADDGERRPDRPRCRFEDASPELLATDPNCWVLHPGESWHGFDELADGWCMLDPDQGRHRLSRAWGDDGKLEKTGFPADLVTAYLHGRGIVPSRTTDRMVLFLFSIGITKGKWGTLLTTLLDFKRDYDSQRPLVEALPGDRRGNTRSARRDRPARIWATKCSNTCAKNAPATC